MCFILIAIIFKSYNKVNTMKIVETNESGKLCIPQDISQEMGLIPGTKFQIQVHGDNIILTKLEKSQDLAEDDEIHELMQLEEESLKDFLVNEPDLYNEEDLKVRYH
jgi:bifunctional DNA-binding transcriptional regulator/antitoxin component of YhaV-PrlF toxin-antitoxin module